MTAFAAVLIKNDRVISKVINRKMHCRVLDLYFGMVTNLGSTQFTILLACAALYFYPAAGEALALNLIISQLIIHALKRAINRARPYHTMECNLIYPPPRCVYSFPSGHSGAALSAALVLSTFFPDQWPLFLAIAASIGFSRIYLGFHFFTDVAAGFLIAYLTFRFFPFQILL